MEDQDPNQLSQVPQEPAQPQAPVQPEQPVMSQPRNTHWILLLIIVILGVGGVVSYIALTRESEPVVQETPTPTPDATASWKTYRNNEFGFNFKYPPTWTLIDSSQNVLTGLSIGVVPPNPEDFVAYFDVGLDTRSLVNIRGAATILEDLQEEVVTFAGKTTYRYTDNVSERIVMFIPHQGKIFQIISRNDLIEVLQIFSTFKFTTPIPDVTVSWKTYRDNEFGFEFMYPKISILRGGRGDTPAVPPGSDNFEINIIYEGKGGYEPPRLKISTIADTRTFIELKNTNIFSTNDGDNLIHFILNNRDVYANCVNYSQEPTVIDFCNQILSTFKFTN